MIRAVLFDFDGTLADTAPDLGFALNEQLLRHGRQPLPISEIRPHASAGARGLLKLGFGIEPDDERFAAMRTEYLDLYDANLWRSTTLFPGVASLLAALEQQHVQWGIVTNKPERFTRPLVERLGLLSRAASLISGDTCTRAKPFPDPLLKAAADMALKPAHVIYVGDDERDVQAAHAAGMRSVIAGYGYLGTGNHPDEWGADALISEPGEILNYLGLTPSMR
jgi:2-phosphoglycolate phosphatase